MCRRAVYADESAEVPESIVDRDDWVRIIIQIGFFVRYNRVRVEKWWPKTVACVLRVAVMYI